jgi:hypothetical protein
MGISTAHQSDHRAHGARARLATVAFGLSVAVVAASFDAVTARASTTPPDGADTPRSVHYAGLTWTVESVDVDSSTQSDDPIIRLGLNVTSSLESLVVSVPASILGVMLADGTLVRASVFDDTDSPGTIVVEPGASIDAVAVVEPDSGTGPVSADALSFVIDEGDVTPAVLPLSGPEVPNPYPIVAEVGGTTGPIPGSCPTASTVEIAVRRASVSLDLEARRAPIDTEFLTIDLAISAIDGFYDSACVSGPFFRLMVDGTVIEPVGGVAISESIVLGTTLETSVSFSVPIGTRTFELGVGADGEAVAALPIVLATDDATATSEKPS